MRGALSAWEGALSEVRVASAFGRLLVSGRLLVALVFLFGGVKGWLSAFAPPGVVFARFASDAGTRASFGETVGA